MGATARGETGSSSPSSGEHKQLSRLGVWLAPLRSRIMTEDAIVFRNVLPPSSDPEGERDSFVDNHHDDELSTVSSLSNDSRRRYENWNGMIMATSPPSGEGPQSPPTEICFSTRRKSTRRLITPIAEIATSHPIRPPPRPPQIITCIDDSPFLVPPRPLAPTHALSSNNNINKGKIIRPGTLATIDSPAYKQGEEGHPPLPQNESQSPAMHRRVHSERTILPLDPLLGDRPKRIQSRQTSCLSLGSLVGQSSYVTDPTTNASSSEEWSTELHGRNSNMRYRVGRVTTTAGATGQAVSSSAASGSVVSSARSSAESSIPALWKRGATCGSSAIGATGMIPHSHYHHDRRVRATHQHLRRGIVREELKYMFHRVTRPIQRITSTKPDKKHPPVQLQRAKGCLT